MEQQRRWIQLRGYFCSFQSHFAARHASLNLHSRKNERKQQTTRYLLLSRFVIQQVVLCVCFGGRAATAGPPKKETRYAFAGSRTRVNRLEGDYANRYTTNAATMNVIRMGANVAPNADHLSDTDAAS